MKEALKVGQRVSLWGYGQDDCGGYSLFVGERGSVLSISTNGYDVAVKQDTDCTVTHVHPRQCRRLKVKQRRRVWIALSEYNAIMKLTGGGVCDVWHSDREDDLMVEFIEARPKVK